MGVFGFSFGKKRRSTKRKSAKKHVKPPARLLRICKKFHVKATKKVGRKRVYKSVATLKKLCLRKARAMKKKMMKMHKKKSSKKVSKRKKVRRSHTMFGFGAGKPMMDGTEEEEQVYPILPPTMARPAPTTARPTPTMAAKQMAMMRCEMPSFGSRRRVPMFGVVPRSLSKRKGGRPNLMEFGAGKPMMYDLMEFGKKRRVGSSKKVAMKAFRSFYKRHCAGRRGMGFGNGGNPPLNASMGYEFCPSGMGGVLGADSTGLFPSPCTSMNAAQASAESDLTLPTYSNSSSYGMRRRRRTSTGVRRKRRCSAVGTRRRTATGVRRKRRQV